MNLKALLGLGFIAGLSACGPTGTTEPAASSEAVGRRAPAEPVDAALIAPDGSPAGRVTMRHGPRGMLFVIEGENWPEGWHGTHLHAVGRCDPPGFDSAGGHRNSHGDPRPHGLLNVQGGPDFGDLPNVHASADGVARAEVYLSGDVLDGADISAHGLSLVVHTSRDDHQTQPIGGAGDRIACAVLAPANQPPSD